jgi:hypothetical protein
VSSWDALGGAAAAGRGLTLAGAPGATFTGARTLIPRIAHRLHLPGDTVTANIGTAAPARAVIARRACLAAFFDRRLRGRDGPACWTARPRTTPRCASSPDRTAWQGATAAGCGAPAAAGGCGRGRAADGARRRGFGLDQQITGARARREPGWTPARLDPLGDLAQG